MHNEYKILTLAKIMNNPELVNMFVKPTDGRMFDNKHVITAIEGDYVLPEDNSERMTLQHRVLMTRQLFIELEKCQTSLYMKPADIQLFDYTVLPLMADFSIRKRLFDAVNWITSPEQFDQYYTSIARGYRELLDIILESYPKITNFNVLSALGYEFSNNNLIHKHKPTLTDVVKPNVFVGDLIASFENDLVIKKVFTNLSLPTCGLLDNCKTMEYNKLQEARTEMLQAPNDSAFIQLTIDQSKENFIFRDNQCKIVKPNSARFLTLLTRYYTTFNF